MKRLLNAFTLIELLVVISIIAILIALLFPIFGIAEEKANRAKCQSNLHQIAIAAAQQFGELGEKLPYRGGEGDQWKYGVAANQLMPYMKNIKEVFDCPSNPGWWKPECVMMTTNGVTYYTEYEFNSYLCSYGAGASTRSKRQNGISDYSVAAYAYDIPHDLPLPPARKVDESTPHGDGINVAYLDGHAAWSPCSEHGINYTVSPAVETTNAFYRRGHIWK